MGGKKTKKLSVVSGPVTNAIVDTLFKMVILIVLLVSSLVYIYCYFRFLAVSPSMEARVALVIAYTVTLSSLIAAVGREVVMTAIEALKRLIDIVTEWCTKRGKASDP